VTVYGKIDQYNFGLSNQKVWFSTDGFKTVLDSVVVDSFGTYWHQFSNISNRGNLEARFLTCRGSYDADSSIFQKGDSLNFDFDYCLAQPSAYFGQVRNGGVGILPSEANLLAYKYDVGKSQFEFSDSISLLPGGYYDFQKDSDDYLIKVIPTQSNSMFAPTYYPQGLKWDDTQSMAVGPHINQAINIDLIPILNRAGAGTISGEVRVHESIEKDGYYAQDIVLLDSNDQAVAYLKTDSSSSYLFEFRNLAYGTYTVWIDQCGIPTFTKSIELTAQNSSYSDLVITAHEAGISVSEFVALVAHNQFNDLLVYPNPFKGMLNIKNLQGEIHVQVFDVSGKQMHNDLKNIYEGQDFIIDTEAWQRGFYVLKIIQGEQIITQKLIKE
jgi:hypothetical protein